MHLLYQNDNYRVRLFEAINAAFCLVKFDYFDPTKKDFQDPTSSSFFSEQLNVDTLYFEARQNDWYQSAGIEEALEFTETYLENRRVVTFGGSMAGYAAIAFSGKLNAQCFIAAAPQFSLHHEFVNEISETRWPFMYDKFRYDFIRTRYFEFSKGVLFMII